MITIHVPIARAVVLAAAFLVVAAGVGAFAGLRAAAAQIHPVEIPPGPGTQRAASLAHGELRYALHVTDAPTPETDDEPASAWAQFRATVILMQAAEENLSDAQALRDIAAAMLTALKAQSISAMPSDPGGTWRAPVAEGLPAQLSFAEGQLALADSLLKSAREHADGARAAFDVARGNVIRLLSHEADADGSEPDEAPLARSPGDLHNAGVNAAARRRPAM